MYVLVKGMANPYGIDRLSVTSTEMADRLHSLLAPHLPPLPYPASLRRDGLDARLVHSCNSNIRMYKYTPGQHFGCHYDDAVRDPQTGARSEWTLLVYLTGVEDGVKGGEVGRMFSTREVAREASCVLGHRLYSTLARKVNGERKSSPPRSQEERFCCTGLFVLPTPCPACSDVR